MQHGQKIVVGCEEWCAFPELGIHAIKARVDSGARTSSLHAFNIQRFTRNNVGWVSFEIHPIQRNRKTTQRCEARVVDRRFVKSSSGEREKRYVITALLQLGAEQLEVELTLSNRDSMGYRMLLGREAMSGRMLVDPAGSFKLGELSAEQSAYMMAEDEASSGQRRIALLASDATLYSNRRIMEAGKQRGHEMIFLDIKHCYIKLEADNPEVIYNGELSLNDLDAVIPRIRPNMTYYGCALTRHFASIGAFPLNRADAIASSRDKLYALQLLQRGGLDIPTTGLAYSPLDVNVLADIVGGAPFVMNVLEGTRGHGVALAETRAAAAELVGERASPRANLLVQEFIGEAQGQDLCCFVVDGKVVAAIERCAAPGDFRASTQKGGSALRTRISKEERRLAIGAVRTMGLQVASVDMVRSRKGPLVLEINSSPGLFAIERATGKDIAGAMIASLEKKLGLFSAPQSSGSGVNASRG